MTEHRLIEVRHEPGQTESRWHAVCACGWIGPDHGTRTPGDTKPIGLSMADHKLHAEGKPVGQGKGNAANPEGLPWSERMGED